MVHPALEPVRLIEDIEERCSAPRARAQYCVRRKGPEDLAPAEQRRSVATHQHGGRVVHAQRFQLGFGLLRILLILEQQLKLLRHDGRNAARGAHARKVQHVCEVARPIEGLAALIFVRQTRLLAQRRAQNQGSAPPRERHELAEQLVHLLVAEQNRALILGLLRGAGHDLEMLRLHVAPVFVLEVRRAVQEERRKRRP